MLQATIRNSVGSSSARSLRKTGMIPASICGEKLETIHIAIDAKNITHRYEHDNGFFNRIMTIKTPDNSELTVLAKNVQLHPVTDKPLHIEFLRVDPNATISVFVPIKFINEDKSPGIKLGGILNVVVHNLNIICRPNDIPEKIIVDLTGLTMHHTVHLKDLNLPDCIKIANPERDDVIATIVSSGNDAAEEKK